MDVACDESGSEGERLVGGVTDVFAHASVRLSGDDAMECVQELRRRIRSPATEYKAGHLLREKNRPALTWLLGPTGPIHGRARVHLTDKEFFVVRKVADLLVDDAEYAATLGLHQGTQARTVAETLYREGRGVLPRSRWRGFLTAFNYLLRPRNRQGVWLSVDDFQRVADDLSAGSSGQVGEILALLRPARPRIEAVLTGLLDDPAAVPALNPIIPAIVAAVGYWSADGQPVSIVHDRQSALTDAHLRQLRELLGGPDPTWVSPVCRGRLAGVTFVESHLDPRVQVADFLAGTARKITEEALHGRGDPELVTLLRPYVDPYSIWADQRSWPGPVPAPVPGLAVEAHG